MRELDEMKLARVIDAAGGIDGRVKMQKIVYLLTAMDYDLPYRDFTIRQLGPYSRAVAVSADLLTAGGFAEVTEERFGTDGAGEPVIQYSYRLRERVTTLVRHHYDIPAPPGKPALDTVARYLRAQDRAVLEVLATRLYLEREDRLTGDDLERELRRLKGHLSRYFPEADRLLQELRGRHWL